jgi:hypothetical protein
MRISTLTAADVPALEALQPEDWQSIIPAFKFYTSSAFCKPIKLTINGHIRGIGAAIYHTSSVWLAHIIVHNDFRNRGIGSMVVQSLFKAINLNTYPTVSLIATALGEPVYKKSGFEREGEYLFFKKTPADLFDEADPHIMPGSGCKREIMDLDRNASGEDRHRVLEPHLDEAKVFRRDGRILGFYLPTLGEGLIVAATVEAGMALMKLRASDKQVYVVPAQNRQAIAFLEANAFKQFQTGLRMSLGQKLTFKGEMIYSRIAGNLG